jgi:N-acetylneuraminate synthase
MVDAANAGVEVVKHQTHIVEDEMSGSQESNSGKCKLFLFMKLWNVVHSTKPPTTNLKNVESNGVFISHLSLRAAAERLKSLIFQLIK